MDASEREGTKTEPFSRSALQGRMQCTAGAVALHCRDGCTALRLRRAKGTLKLSVLFWIREKGKRLWRF